MGKQIEEVSEEILDILVSLTGVVIGNENQARLLKELEPVSKSDRKIYIYKFASTVELILGKNKAFATLRQVGRNFAQKLMEIFPKDQWNDVFNDCLRQFGFAEKIEKNNQSAFICNCVFYDILKKNNLGPTQHPICWTGWGLIEGFMKEFESVKKIQWIARDVENMKCQFDFIRNK